MLLLLCYARGYIHPWQGNNLKYPSWGVMDTALHRIMPSAYAYEGFNSWLRASRVSVSFDMRLYFKSQWLLYHSMLACYSLLFFRAQFLCVHSDGFSKLAGQDRPSPRHISNMAMSERGAEQLEQHEQQQKQAPSVNDLFAHFGQFIAHDISHTPNIHSMLLAEVAHIPVPKGESHACKYKKQEDTVSSCL